MTAQERNVLITTCMGHFLSHFNMLTFPAVVLPLAPRLDLPLAQVLGMSPAAMYRIHVANAGLTRIRTDRERTFTLVSHGST